MELERPNKEIRVGGETEAYCTKCRRDTTHMVVTLDGTKIKKVECLSCKGQHMFRAPKGTAEEAPEKTEPGVRIKKTPNASRASKKDPSLEAVVETDVHDELDDELASLNLDPSGEGEGVFPESEEDKPAKAKGRGREPKALKDPGESPPKGEDPADDIDEEELGLLKDINIFGDDELDGIDSNPFDDDLDLDFGTAEIKPRGKGKKPKALSAKKTKEQKRQDDLREQHSLEWSERTRSINPDKAVLYSTSGSYDFDQPVRHSVFGVGYVTKVVPPNKIHVKFKEDTKILITNVEKEKAEPGGEP
ncbi:MAG: hypothetical protein LBR53_02290 [Deltaproteobacteria bacterium]|jgi:hypothetical protein|nr:hypothetical protein [Deltaproteobacteria bacterium]